MRAVVPPLTYRGCPDQVATLHQDGAVRAAASPPDHPLHWPRDRILETSNQVLGDPEVCLTFSVRLRFASDCGHSKRNPKPAYTLPVLDKKIYLITSPSLLQSIFRSKDLSFEPFMLEFSQRLLGVSDKVMEPTRRQQQDPKAPSFVQQVIKEICVSLSGQALVDMDLCTLNGFASMLNGINETFSVDALYFWLRSTLTLATTNTLFGSHNPMRSQPDLGGLYW